MSKTEISYAARSAADAICSRLGTTGDAKEFVAQYIQQVIDKATGFYLNTEISAAARSLEKRLRCVFRYDSEEAKAGCIQEALDEATAAKDVEIERLRTCLEKLNRLRVYTERMEAAAGPTTVEQGEPPCGSECRNSKACRSE